MKPLVLPLGTETGRGGFAVKNGIALEVLSGFLGPQLTD
jgi:hypothetical protein